MDDALYSYISAACDRYRQDAEAQGAQHILILSFEEWSEIADAMTDRGNPPLVLHGQAAAYRSMMAFGVIMECRAGIEERVFKLPPVLGPVFGPRRIHLD